MSYVHAVACDFHIAPAQTQYGLRDRHPCPATSRPATTQIALRTVASRDGWSLTGDRHLCPFHAATEATP